MRKTDGGSGFAGGDVRSRFALYEIPAFSKKPRGYDPDEVDRYLNALVKDYERVCAGGLTAFNREYGRESAQAKSKPKESFLRSSIFYGVLLLAVAAAFFYSNGDNPGNRIGPFSYNTVLTTSMQSVYPKGSLVTSWVVKPGEPLQAGLDKGTDIVFVREDGMVVVHRIIEIMDNYEESGQRAFRTQGVDNPTRDDWVTYEGNVVGRVTWHVKYVGDILAFVAEKAIWVVAAFILLFALLNILKFIFRKDPPESHTDTKEVDVV